MNFHVTFNSIRVDLLKGKDESVLFTAEQLAAYMRQRAQLAAVEGMFHQDEAADHDEWVLNLSVVMQCAELELSHAGVTQDSSAKVIRAAWVSILGYISEFEDVTTRRSSCGGTLVTSSIPVSNISCAMLIAWHTVWGHTPWSPEASLLHLPGMMQRWAPSIACCAVPVCWTPGLLLRSGIVSAFSISWHRTRLIGVRHAASTMGVDSMTCSLVGVGDVAIHLLLSDFLGVGVFAIYGKARCALYMELHHILGGVYCSVRNVRPRRPCGCMVDIWCGSLPLLYVSGAKCMPGRSPCSIGTHCVR